jgi:hypothetical protein
LSPVSDGDAITAVLHIRLPLCNSEFLIVLNKLGLLSVSWYRHVCSYHSTLCL